MKIASSSVVGFKASSILIRIRGLDKLYSKMFDGVSKNCRGLHSLPVSETPTAH